MNIFQDFLSWKKIFFLSLFLICFNLFVLNLWMIQMSAEITSLKNSSNASSIQTNERETVSESLALDACPISCVAKINQATSSMNIQPTERPAKTVSKKTETSSSPIQIGSSVKEFYIPFGSGSSSAGDWTDIPGLQAYVDSTQYGKIRSVVFEATIRIPTGNQIGYARLFNATDKHPVWFSEVSLEGGTPKLLTSAPITLDKGNKLYQVQMRTSLKYQTFLDQARLRITVY